MTGLLIHIVVALHNVLYINGRCPYGACNQQIDSN